MPKFEVDWEEYSKFASDYAYYQHNHTGDYYEINYLVLGLGGEAGECVDAWKKITRELDPCKPVNISYPLSMGARKDVIAMLYEMGDVMWYISHLLRTLGISMDDLLLCNTYKLHMRHQLNHASWGWPYDDIDLKDAADRVRQIEDLITYTPPLNRVPGDDKH